MTGTNEKGGERIPAFLDGYCLGYYSEAWRQGAGKYL